MTPTPPPKKKSEPRIFRPQGDTNVFTAINLFKIGALPGDDHSSLHTGADFEKVDCPLPHPPPPHPNPHPTPKEKSEPRIFGPQGDTNVFTAINLFKIGAQPGDDHSSLYMGADFEKVDCPLPPPHPTPRKKSEPRIFRPQGDKKRVHRNQPFENRRTPW